jgi:hypothetical protein
MMPIFIDSANFTLADVECDICIVGAGAAGIFLATRLALAGADVILIEAGGLRCLPPDEAGFDAKFPASPYPGATLGRSMGVGGATSRWGGLLVPHSSADLRFSEPLQSGTWEHIVETVKKHGDSVLNTLGLRQGGQFESFSQEALGEMFPALESVGLKPIASLFLPFRNKNMAFLLRKADKLKVFYHAVVTGFEIKPGAGGQLVRRVNVTSSSGRMCGVQARRIVVAAGAIETTRLLLELQEQTDVFVCRPKSSLGHFLGDHLSITIADVPTDVAGQVIQAFGPRFAGGWMRSFRFLEHTDYTEIPRSFSHFIFNIDNEGFYLAKEVLSSMQQRRVPCVSTYAILKGLSGIMALCVKRYLYRRLYMPSNTSVHLQLDVEQLPHVGNSIFLGQERDHLGRLIPNICWAISEQDMERIHNTAKRVLERWRRAGLPALVDRKMDWNNSKPHDAYHPVGTCRMGRDEAAVVDEKLKVWGLDNLWLTSTAVFPTAGTANPTFSLLCLTEALAQDLLASRN